ncbi:MAG: hypothetical protein ABJ242_08425 [Marinomonas sp.]
MNSLIASLAPLALILPFAGGAEDVGSENAASKANEQNSPVADTCRDLSPKHAEQMAQSEGTIAANGLETDSSLPPILNQIRIERRVIIRVAPQSARQRSNLVADLPRQAPTSKWVERKIGKCLPVSRIAGVQTASGSKLLLYLRDKSIISLKLEKSCRARDYYSGFYVEKNKDGKLCVDRDKLMSRSGAKCEVERLRQLVSVSR